MERTAHPVETIFETVLIGLMVVLTIVSTGVRIMVFPVPITLQTLVIILSGILIGPRRGWLVPALYMAVGLLGLPVFAGGGGPGYVLQPTFGFILGFIPGALVAGYFGNRPWFGNNRCNIWLGSLLGMLVIYGIGLAYIPLIANLFGSKATVWVLLLPILPWLMIGDLLKILVASMILPVLQRELAHIRRSL
jgi:biotin transport system substrate-specific component